VNRLRRWGIRLARLTIAWNLIEGGVALAAGIIAGSIALLGFGGDSYVEVFAGSVILWHLTSGGHDDAASQERERRARRLIAVSFLLLAVAITAESTRKLLTGSHPEESLPGIVLAAVSLVVMPLLAAAKRRVGLALGSRAVVADAAETLLCTWLSLALLLGLALNALWGWWWADPAGGLAIAALAGREGVEHWGEDEEEET
jgi:divalent metal cation (Fe/Co/Zn/Cd) transporter